MIPVDLDKLDQLHAEAEAWLKVNGRDRQRGEFWEPREQCGRCPAWLKIGEVKLCESCKAFVGDKK